MIESKLLVQIVISLAAFLGIILGIRLTRGMIRRFGEKHHFQERRSFYVNKIIAILFVILFLLLLSIIWGFDVEGLSIYFASFFGLVGIAFFASWSLLSNITASLIIFFYYRVRIADRIRILDGENSVTGEVKNITMFTVIIETEDGKMVTYPNNLFIQKPVQMVKNI